MSKRNRFTSAESTRLDLSDGDHLIVKHRMSHGDREEMFARMSPRGVIERTATRNALVLAYLLGWSFVDAQGEPVAYSLTMPADDRLAAIRNLSPEDFDEVYEAIDKHDDGAIADREALKKARAGSRDAGSISPSPSGTDSGTNG